MVRVEAQAKRPVSRRKLGKGTKKTRSKSQQANSGAGIVGYLKSWLPVVLGGAKETEEAEAEEVLVEDEEEPEVDDTSGSGQSTGRPFGDELSAAAFPFGEGSSAAAVPAPTPSASELVFAAARVPGKAKAKGTSNGAPSGVKVLDISSRPPLQMSTPSHAEIPPMQTPAMQTPAFASSVQTISPHTVGRRNRQPVMVTVQASPGYDASVSTSQSFVNRSVMNQSTMGQSFRTGTGSRRRAVPLRSPFRRAGANTSTDSVTTTGESLKRGRTSPLSLSGVEQSRPMKQRVHSLVDTPKASSADGLTSDTAKRILNAINKVSSPLSDASRLAKFQPSARPRSADQRSVSLSGTPIGRIPRTGLPSSVKRDPFRYTPRAKRGLQPVDFVESTPAPVTRKVAKVSDSTELDASKRTKLAPTTAPFTSASEAKATSEVAETVPNGLFKPSAGTKLLEKTGQDAAKPAMGGFSAFAKKKPTSSPSASKPSPFIDAKLATTKTSGLPSVASKPPAAKPVPGLGFVSATSVSTPEQSKSKDTTASLSFSSAAPVDKSDGAAKLPASFKKAPSSQGSSPTAVTSTPTAVKAASALKKSSSFDFSPAKKLDVSKAAAESSPTVGGTSFSFAKGSPIGATAGAASFDTGFKKIAANSASSDDANEKKEPAISSTRAMVGTNDVGSSSPLAAAVSATYSKPKSALPFATRSTLSTGSTDDAIPTPSVWGKIGSDAAKPPSPAFSFGSKTETPTAIAATAKPAAAFAFGGATSIDAKKELPTAAAATAKPAAAFAFGGATSIVAKKELPTAAATAAAATAFAFGGATPAEAKKEVPAAVADTVADAPKPTAALSFGGAAPTETAVFSFGDAGAAPSETEKNSQVAATDTAKPAASFSFGGAAPADAKKPASAANVVEPAAAFSFGSTKTEAPAWCAAKLDAPTLLADPSVSPFGAKKTDASKPAFSFGVTSAAAPQADTAAAPAAPASAAAAPPIKFGFSDSLEKSRSPFGTPTPGPVGLPKAKHSGPQMMSGDSDTSVPAAPAGGFQFSGVPASTAVPVSTSFGAAPAAVTMPSAVTVSSGTGFSFAATSVPAPTTAPGGFNFGASAGAATGPRSASGGDGFQFGASTGTPAAATPAAASGGFQFGAGAGLPAATTPVAASGGFQFSASAVTPAAAAPAAVSGGFQFGASAGTPAAATPAAASGGLQFGASTGTPVAAPTATTGGGFQFGGTPAAAAAAAAASSTSFSAAPPITNFGAASPAPFGAAPPNFGTASPAPSTSFGAAPSAGFGGGGATAAATTGFGTGAGAGGGAGFAFGGSGASAAPATTGGGGFQFGGATPSAGGDGGGGGFGAPQAAGGGFGVGASAPAAGGFGAGASSFGASSGGSSFNAGASAGSSFGAPAPASGGFNAGAFNPGTSNTSGRKIIKARRRGQKK